MPDVNNAFDELDVRVGRLMRACAALERVLYVVRYQLEVADLAGGNAAKAAARLKTFKEGEVDPLNRLLKHITFYLDKPSARKALGNDWLSANELWAQLSPDLLALAAERNFVAHADVFAENGTLVWRGGDVFTGPKRPVSLAGLDALVSRVNACYVEVGKLRDICRPHLVSNDRHEVGRDHDDIHIAVAELSPEQQVVHDWFIPALRAGARGTECILQGQLSLSDLSFEDFFRIASAYRDEVAARGKRNPDQTDAPRAGDG